MSSETASTAKRTFRFTQNGELDQIGPSESGAPRKKRVLNRKKCKECRRNKKKVSKTVLVQSPHRFCIDEVTIAGGFKETKKFQDGGADEEKLLTFPLLYNQTQRRKAVVSNSSYSVYCVSGPAYCC
jgi:hypothetical protein